ncbi:MAG: putative selenium-dependent hydroxylase accessory protein YqeC [bacterium]|nr:putative selenium-dependent hydroxylase accessory protein YqeC [bacterium]
MTDLAGLLGLGDRELISLVGGGGKSTMLFRLGDELTAAGKRIVLTTTTKMGRDQTTVVETICRSADTRYVIEALDKPGPVMIITGGDDHKVTGPPPDVVDDLFKEPKIDYIVVEADGSRGRPLKAPAAHEPVIPSLSTVVVILVGIEAVGQPLGEVTHRIEEAVRFTGLDSNHILTPADCAAILVHPEGALRACPAGSRVFIGLTKANSTADQQAARSVTDAVGLLAPDVTVVTVPVAG